MEEKMKKEEFKKKDGSTGYQIALKPKSMSMQDRLVGTFLTNEVSQKTLPAGISKLGRPYEAFEVYSIFLSVDGDGCSVGIPKGTATKLMKELDLKGKQIEFFKAEVNVSKTDEPDYRVILDYKLEGSPSSSFVVTDELKKVYDYYKNNDKSPNDVLEYKGQVKTFKEVLINLI